MTNHLDQIQIASPCPVSWESMVGDDVTRHCESCNLNVHDLSAMTKREAEEFLTKLIPSGRVCATFYRRADGTILTDNCPLGLRILRNKIRSVQIKIAAVIAFLISFLPSQAQTNDQKDLQKEIQRNTSRQPGCSRAATPGLSRTTGVIADNQASYDAYMSYLRRSIRAAWRLAGGPPRQDVIVIFRINKEGKMSGLRIKKSSGFSHADLAALEAIKNAAPFSPLPSGANKGIEITFTFSEEIETLGNPEKAQVSYRELK